MAVVIRMSKMGTKKKPHHKIVVMDERSPRDGRFIEALGYYDPSKNPALIEINGERALYWYRTGAKLSPTVRSIFKKKNIPLTLKKGGSNG